MPNVVKGSKQHQMVVVPYRPWYRVSLSVFLIMLFVAVGAAAYFYGQYVAQQRYLVNRADNERLSQALAESQGQLNALRSELVITDRSNIVDRRATEEVQGTINGLRQRILELEQDVSFYRQVMSPESTDLNLVIAEFGVTPIEQSARYHYKAVFRQAGAGDKVLEGSAQINIIGQRDGQREVLSLSDLVLESASFEPNLSFRYFQNIEGELQLPDGFTPDQVEVLAESTKPTAIKVEKVFSWSVVEAQ